MAHTCPECGQCCYCGGDIDDCCHDMPDDVARCTHCPPFGEGDDDDEWEPWDDEPNYGNMQDPGSA